MVILVTFLLHGVLRLHVKLTRFLFTFANFNIVHIRVLEYVLDAGNAEYYPLVCADVTATFTVLSSTINAIRRDLGLRTVQSAIEIVELINRLQSAEQSKLQLTAALHLERIRSQAIQRETSSISHVQKNGEDMDQIGNGNEMQLLDADSQTATEQEDRITLLLEESIQTLRKKIASTIVEINDVLEELRYAVVDSNDDDQPKVDPLTT